MAGRAGSVSEATNTELLGLDARIIIPDKLPDKAGDFREKAWSILTLMNSKLDQLPQLKSDLKDAQEQLKTPISDYETLKSNYDDLLNENNSNKKIINLLSSKISVLEKKLSKQSADHDDLTTRSMNQNLIFSFKEASRGETACAATTAAKAVGNDAAACKRHVESIIRDQLKADNDSISVQRAHRLGEQKPQGKCAPIIARLSRREMVGEALKLGKNLKDTGIFINPQLPPSVAERRQFCRSEYMEARNTPGATAKMSNDRLFINNELQRHLLAPNLPDTDISTFEPRPLRKSGVVNNDHCNVQSFRGDVSSLEDVRAVYDSVLAENTPTPDSLLYAYRFDDAGTVRQNFDSGVEGGVGFKILRELQDKRKIGTMVVVGIWYNNHNAPLKGAGFYKNFYDVIGDILT